MTEKMEDLYEKIAADEVDSLSVTVLAEWMMQEIEASTAEVSPLPEWLLNWELTADELLYRSSAEFQASMAAPENFMISDAAFPAFAPVLAVEAKAPKV